MRGDGNRGGAGFTLIELLIVVAIIGVIGAIAVPSLMRAQIAANETSAIGSLRAVQSAEMSYQSAAGGGGYAVLLATLATACPGGRDGYISPDLAIDPSVKSGYRIVVQIATGSSPTRADCNGTMAQTGFYSTATPVAFPRSGRRGYATTAGAGIYFSESGIAPTEAAMAPGGGGSLVQ